MRTSVIIAAYNADPYLADSIASVLDQSQPPHEVIVVANAPSNRTPTILDSFGARIIARIRARKGAAAALNEGVSLATGDLLAFQDADDLWLPDKIDRQLEALASLPEVEAVFGHIRQFVSPDVPEERRAQLMPPREVMPGVSKITMVISRAAFARVGSFDETKESVEFVDWYSRALGVGLRSHMLPEVVALRRLHLANNGRVDTLNRDRENLASLKSMLDVRRAVASRMRQRDG